MFGVEVVSIFSCFISFSYWLSQWDDSASKWLPNESILFDYHTVVVVCRFVESSENIWLDSKRERIFLVSNFCRTIPPSIRRFTIATATRYCHRSSCARSRLLCFSFSMQIRNRSLFNWRLQVLTLNSDECFCFDFIFFHVVATVVFLWNMQITWIISPNVITQRIARYYI